MTQSQSPGEQEGDTTKTGVIYWAGSACLSQQDKGQHSPPCISLHPLLAGSRTACILLSTCNTELSFLNLQVGCFKTTCQSPAVSLIAAEERDLCPLGCCLGNQPPTQPYTAMHGRQPSSPLKGIELPHTTKTAVLHRVQATISGL